MESNIDFLVEIKMVHKTEASTTSFCWLESVAELSAEV